MARTALNIVSQKISEILNAGGEMGDRLHVDFLLSFNALHSLLTLSLLVLTLPLLVFCLPLLMSGDRVLGKPLHCAYIGHVLLMLVDALRLGVAGAVMSEVGGG